jgi:hypothetical protein
MTLKLLLRLLIKRERIVYSPLSVSIAYPYPKKDAENNH